MHLSACPSCDRAPYVLASMLITAVFIGIKVTAVRASFALRPRFLRAPPTYTNEERPC